MVTLYNKIKKETLADMPKVSFGGRIYVINSESEARKAVDYLNSQPIVGVDTETRPSYRKGTIHKVALLQVSTEDTCFLFRLNRMGIPDFLEDFLQNDVLKVGLSLKDDFMMLRRTKEGDLRQGNWIELQDYVPLLGIEEKGLQRLYALLFQKKISKSQRLTNWEADVLTGAQQLYAATDAWACIVIYNYLEQLRLSGDYRIEKLPEETPVTETNNL